MLRVHDCSFQGNIAEHPTVTQDCIVLGGTINETGSTIDNGFQGYGTVIAGNYFSYVRRGVWCRVYANAAVIRENTWWHGCKADATAAAIEIGTATTQVGGVVVEGNIFECQGYHWVIKLTNAASCWLDGNGFYDPGENCVAYIRQEGPTGTTFIRNAYDTVIAPTVVVSDANLERNNGRIAGRHFKIDDTLSFLTGDIRIGGNTSPTANNREGGLVASSWAGYMGALPAGVRAITPTSGNWYASADLGFYAHAGPDSTAGTPTLMARLFGATGDLSLQKIGGGLRIKEGTNACMGQATLVDGTVTVATNRVEANSRIQLTVETPGGTQGFISYAKTPGVSFVISSTSATETSTVNWIINNPS